MKADRPMYFGTPTLCLRATDLAASRRFYEALGMEVLEDVPGLRVVLRRGSFNVALMTFLEGNCLNLRGADVFAAHAHLKARGLDVEGEPERYARAQHLADADGECWSTRDPDGNVILFDTNELEKSAAFERERLTRLLENTEQELLDVGAPAECLRAFREEILSKYASPKRRGG